MKINHEDLIGSYEQKKKLVSQFSLFQDIFFSAVMKDKDAAEYVLRLCMDMPDLTIVSSNIQQSLRNLFGRSAILDFIAQDSSGTLFNIEVQSSDSKEYFGPKRSRYYQSIIDASFVHTGMDFDKLPDVYIIFLTPFNPLKKANHNKVVYHKHSDLDGVEWNSGIHEIYINAEETDNTRLSEMLQYFIKADPEDNRFGALSKVVGRQKGSEKEVISMCQAVENYANERETIKAVKMVNNLLKKGELLKNALECAEIDEETYNKYKDKI